MTFLTVAWGPVVNAGLPPRRPDDGTRPVSTVGWLPKTGTEFYPYPGDDLAAAVRASRRPPAVP
jgi:hypothetical protein